MRLSALRIDDGANTLGCLPLQRMPSDLIVRKIEVAGGGLGTMARFSSLWESSSLRRPVLRNGINYYDHA
jgi:hypothetical protein